MKAWSKPELNGGGRAIALVGSSRKDFGEALQSKQREGLAGGRSSTSVLHSLLPLREHVSSTSWEVLESCTARATSAR